VTPNSPTWGEVRSFLEADRWRPIPSGERGGSQSDHIFYEKVLANGRVLQTHISHSLDKRPHPHVFALILREQLEVSRTDFWECIRSGRPVDRPVPVEAAPKEHPAWVVQVLAGELHMTGEEIMALELDEAERLVQEHWSRPR
jgi:hypothetical protein